MLEAGPGRIGPIRQFLPGAEQVGAPRQASIAVDFGPLLHVSSIGGVLALR
jgi:hypothetical protein